MAILQEEMTVISQQEIARDIYEMVLKGDLVADIQKPDEFLNLLVPDSRMLLRRPISISEYDKSNQTATIIYRAGDETTGTRALSNLTAGQKVDVMGPLGNGFDTDFVKSDQNVVIVGGGIGTPPLYGLAQKLSKIGCQITVLIGFATKDVVILEEKFAALSNVTVKVTTDDGTYGNHGHVGLLMDALDFKPDVVYACGAPMMLKAVVKKYEKLEQVYISMESRMACAIGACYACVVHDKHDENHALKVCEDGPVFNAQDVIA